MTIQEAQEAVAGFMRLGGQTVAELPRVGPISVAQLRFDLQREEAFEYWEAVCSGNVAAIADALADQLYVLLGSAASHGIDLDPVFAEVHRSNMTKVVDGALNVRPDGKILKPPSYEPPDIHGVLMNQTLRAALEGGDA